MSSTNLLQPAPQTTDLISTLISPSAAGAIFELPGHRHDTAGAPAAPLKLYTASSFFCFELFLFSYVLEMVNKRV